MGFVAGLWWTLCPTSAGAEPSWSYLSAKSAAEQTQLSGLLQSAGVPLGPNPTASEDFRIYPRFTGPVPVLEFVRHSSSTYYLRVHGAKQSFPLVFLASYHHHWKVYFRPRTAQRPPELQKEEYKVLEGNQVGQANWKELQAMLAKGWVSDLGDLSPKQRPLYDYRQGEVEKRTEDYQVDFISKPFYNSLQNNNLTPPAWYSLIGAQPWFGESHGKYGEFGNFWWIDLEALKKAGLLEGTPEAGYEFDLVLEFLPQRYYFLGSLASGFFLLAGLAYLVWDRRKKPSP
ncbi:MAG: hypothetical protein A2600_07890 [Candidatus Lambdaproteobacteria bacterium RIFOXYD1_FULL_56_27]|nr:MAG: hypothetical protein A2426_09845 [Candidatus Lambdaproteobacteria bacterium RIFOXYC1_FULL_56_13]OGH09694.1 MAG: hypothetical protein A2600_07890 [Candidatus Lambdaproteobacteria bacterium RIFOXYD1_FULL_56_27]